MKKFLTVLLALSVVFTYSFSAVGTVFAGTEEDQYASNVWKAANQVTTTYNAEYQNAIEQLADTDDTGYPISKEAWLSGAKAYDDAQKALITARAEELVGLYDALKNESFANLVAKFSVAKNGELATGHNAAGDAPALTAANIVTGIHEMSVADGSGSKDVAYRTAFDAYKQSILTAINGVDTSIYSTKAVSATDSTTSKEYVEQFIKEQRGLVNRVTITATATAAKVKDAFDELGKIATRTYTPATGETDEVYGAYAGGANGDGNPAIQTALFGKTYNVNDATQQAISYALTGKTFTVDGDSVTVKTTDDDAIADESLSAKKAAKKAALASELAALKEGMVALTTAEKANAQAFADSFETVVLYQIENADDTAINAVNTTISGADAAAKAAYAKDADNNNAKANIEAYAALEAYAKKQAAEVDNKGALVRDAEKVQKVLDAAKAAYYVTDRKVTNLTVTVEGINTTAAAPEALIKDNCYTEATVDAFAISSAVAALEDELAGKELDLTNKDDTYYDKEYQQVKALYEAQIAKVKAATTAKELHAATDKTELNKALGKIYTADLIDSGISTWVESAYNNGLSQYVAVVKAERNNEATFDAAYKAMLETTDATVSAASWNTWYAKQGARTEAEVKALYNAACAAVKALPTKAALDTEKAAVEGMISALPATITVADKDAVVAAKDALDAYEAKGGSGVKNAYSLNLKIAALKAALQKEITDAVTALPAGANAKAEHKTAFKAAMEKMDAYNKLVKGTFGESAFYAGTQAQYVKVNTGLTTIKGIEKNAIEAAIDALPINITMANKEAVEAVRAAYDAYVAEYSDPIVPVDARTDFNATKISELVAAEKALEELADKEQAEQIKVVESLKITASSTVKKGSITVKWSVKGDTSVADGFEVFRSVKKNSGFTNKAFYTTDKNTKRTYKNTKSLKKGTRYYYKVRAYKVVDGVKYYSDWSNKAYRIAK